MQNNSMDFAACAAAALAANTSPISLFQQQLIHQLQANQRQLIQQQTNKQNGSNSSANAINSFSQSSVANSLTSSVSTSPIIANSNVADSPFGVFGPPAFGKSLNIAHQPTLFPNDLMFPILPKLPHSPTNEDGSSHPLFSNNMCKWPACERICEDFPAFLKHLSSEHILDDKCTAQLRVQQQVVSQLEAQLHREREIYLAMNAHLQNKKQSGIKQETPSFLFGNPLGNLFLQNGVLNTSGAGSLMASLSSLAGGTGISSAVVTSPAVISQNTALLTPPSNSSNSTSSTSEILCNMIQRQSMANNNNQSFASPLNIESLTAPVISAGSPNSEAKSSYLDANSPPTALLPNGGGPIKRRDKSMLPLAAEIDRNRDYYQSSDVRPPFTYASLIRQSILDHPDKQLTLNEIYNWFQKTFAYFRRNAATWKNAVRHNLSLHKCFIRMENIKGSVWTVDEVEFQRRRLQRLGSKVDSGNHESSSINSPECHVSAMVSEAGSMSFVAKEEPMNFHVNENEALNLSVRTSGCSPLPTMVNSANTVPHVLPRKNQIQKTESMETNFHGQLDHQKTHVPDSNSRNQIFDFSLSSSSSKTNPCSTPLMFVYPSCEVKLVTSTHEKTSLGKETNGYDSMEDSSCNLTLDFSTKVERSSVGAQNSFFEDIGRETVSPRDSDRSSSSCDSSEISTEISTEIKSEESVSLSVSNCAFSSSTSSSMQIVDPTC